MFNSLLISFLVQAANKLGVLLRDHGDKIDGDPTLKKAVVSFVADVAEKMSVLQVTQAVFDTLCDKVLSSVQHRDGGHQVLAIHVCSADEGQHARNSCPELRIFFLLASHGLIPSCFQDYT